MNVNVTVIPVCPQFVSSFRWEEGGNEKEIQTTELPIRFTKGEKWLFNEPEAAGSDQELRTRTNPPGFSVQQAPNRAAACAYSRLMGGEGERKELPKPGLGPGSLRRSPPGRRAGAASPALTPPPEGSRILTADFHAAEGRGLLHRLAALREGGGPGPPGHGLSPALPQRRSPLSSSCLRPPPRPGGPACRSLARSAAGDGWDAPHETPGPPLPPPGKPPPLSVSVAQRLLLLLPLPAAPPHAARSSQDHPSRPRRWVREPPPPGAAPERGGFAGPRCPHPGRQSHGAEARGPAPPIPPPPRFSPFICFILSFPFSSFSSFSSFPPPRSSPSPSPLREAAGNGTIFFPGGGIRGTAERRRCGNESQ